MSAILKELIPHVQTQYLKNLFAHSSKRTLLKSLVKKTDDGSPLFFLALRVEGLKIVSRVLDLFASDQTCHLLTQRDRDGSSAFDLAVQRNRSDEISLFLSRLSRRHQVQVLDTEDFKGSRLLATAIATKKLPLVKALFNPLSPSDRWLLLMKKDRFNLTLLHTACAQGTPGIVGFLLNSLPQKVLVNLLTQKNSKGETLLRSVSQKNKLPILRELLKVLSQTSLLEILSVKSDDGLLPLSAAIRKENIEAVREILEALPTGSYKRVLNERGSESTPFETLLKIGSTPLLSTALKFLSAEELTELLTQKIPDSESSTLLMAFSKNKEFLRTLFSSISPDTLEMLFKLRGSCFRTHFFLAALSKNSELIDLLAELLPKNAFARGFLYFPNNFLLNTLIEKESVDIVRSILTPFTPEERKVFLNHSLFKNLNALDAWACFPNKEMKELLLSMGATFSGSSATPFTDFQERAIQKIRLRTDQGTHLFLFPYFTLPPLVKSLDPTSKYLNVYKAFSKTADYYLLSIEELADRILAGEPVVIPTSWYRHQTALVFAGSLVMKCNRGDRAAASHSGIQVFEMLSPPTRKTLIQTIALLRKENQAPAGIGAHLFYIKLNEILKLTPKKLTADETAYFKQKQQKQPNCVNASAKSALRALLYWTILQEKGAASKQDLDQAKAFYKRVTLADRREANARLRILSIRSPTTTRAT
jgi:ankyrin repeat protein